MISSLSHKFKAPNLDEDPAGYRAFVEQLIQLRLICLGWEECSRYLRVPVRDLFRWRERNGFIDPLQKNSSEIDTYQLDSIILEFLQNHPFMGEVSLRFTLMQSGINISRQALRDSINRLDPIGRKKRYQF
jgi:hypothetical protein